EYGSFNNIQDICVGIDGQIYVLDSDNNRVQIFDSTGSFIKIFGGAGEAEGKFNAPKSIVLDDYGNILVADTGNNRIQVFNDQGEFLESFGNILSPGSIYVDIAANIYVASKVENCVKVYSPIFYEYSEKINLNSPGDMVIDRFGNKYVIDTENHVVQIYDPEWNIIKSFPAESEKITLDSNGNIYLLDSNSWLIKEFDASGNMICDFPVYPDGNMTYENIPGGIFTDKDNYIYVGHFNRVEKFRAVEQETVSEAVAVIDSPTDNEKIPRGINLITGKAYGSTFSSYRIEYGEGDDPSVWTQITSVNQPVARGTLACWDTYDLPVNNYTLRLTVVKDNEEEIYDTVNVQLFPPEVKDAKATSGSKKTIITWVNPTDGFEGIKIIRNESSVLGDINEKISAGGEIVFDGIDSTYTDTGLINGKIYYYSLFTYDIYADYSRAVEISTTPVENELGKPTCVAVFDTQRDAGGSITITWIRSKDDGGGTDTVTGYDILRSTVSGSGYETVGSVLKGIEIFYDDMFYSADPPLDDTDYYYIVRAKDENYSDSDEAGPVKAIQNNPWKRSAELIFIDSRDTTIVDTTVVDTTIAQSGTKSMKLVVPEEGLEMDILCYDESLIPDAVSNAGCEFYFYGNSPFTKGSFALAAYDGFNYFNIVMMDANGQIQNPL
ncbi:MAG TPA: hypothetical protein ENH49_06540, partial [Candidatus Marinimicrobia bacterium]|nr:hypothetical protein [Candidatus Neomarinimicrobiota bacterium]